jgi:acyl carrier protein
VTPTEARDVVLDALREIAPEIDLDALDDDADLRDAVDLDSLDFLRLVESVFDATGVTIDENDYPDVRSLGGMSRYVEERSTEQSHN